MIIAVTWDEAEHRVISSPRGRMLTRTSFIEPAALAEKAWRVETGGSGDEREGPQAILAQYPTPEVIEPHFHRTDQFQIVVEGGGRIGKRPFNPVSVQYTDGYTPYSIIPNPTGISFFVLRAHADTGAYPMPKDKDKKLKRGGRGLVSRVLPPEVAIPDGTVVPEVLLEPDDDGMAALMLRAGSGAVMTAATSKPCEGQFQVITRGSARFGDKELPRWSVLWVGPDDESPRLIAGPKGCDLIVIRFPKRSV